MNFNYFGLSDIGKQMPIMEDYFDGFEIRDDLLCICLADGMGSAQGLDVASLVAVSEFKKYMLTNSKTDNILEVEDHVRKAIYMINRIIYSYQRIAPEKYNRFATTLTLMVINKRREIVTANIGNSRFYLLRGDQLVKMTKDDTEAMKLLEKQEITEIEYAKHPDRNVLTKYLGQPEIEPFIFRGALLQEDIILLMTNGVFEMIPDEKIKQIIQNTETSKQACEWLINGANEMGGFDNSAVVISYINF